MQYQTISILKQMLSDGKKPKASDLKDRVRKTLGFYTQDTQGMQGKLLKLQEIEYFDTSDGKLYREHQLSIDPEASMPSGSRCIHVDGHCQLWQAPSGGQAQFYTHNIITKFVEYPHHFKKVKKAWLPA